MSAADLAAVLLAEHFRYDFDDPKSPANDRLIFSKGHASPLVYAMFRAAGAIWAGTTGRLDDFGGAPERVGDRGARDGSVSRDQRAVGLGHEQVPGGDGRRVDPAGVVHHGGAPPHHARGARERRVVRKLETCRLRHLDSRR
jgi:hypothetical protein